MKAVILLLLTMSTVLSICGVTDAASASQSTGERAARSTGETSQDAKPAEATDAPLQNRRIPARGRLPLRGPRGRTGPAAAAGPARRPLSPRASSSGAAVPRHRPGPGLSGGATAGGFVQRNAVRHTLPVQSSGVLRPSVASLNMGHHRGPNPAVVGGSATVRARSTGAINGTGLNRQPQPH
jgi:hypothetical protein